MTLLSANVTQSLCEQILSELYNASLYTYIYAYLKNKGLDKLAKHFEEQIKEEQGHAKSIVDFLTDMNEEVSINEVKAVQDKFENILEIAKAYLDREKETTESLAEIKNLCIESGDAVAEEFLRKMIYDQRKELEEANTWNDRAALTRGDWSIVMLWDASL